MKAGIPYSMKSIKPAHGDRGSTKRRTAPRRTGSNTESRGAGNAPKRKRASQPKTTSTSKKIACVSCGQADVPLMMGGRKFPCTTHGAKLIMHQVFADCAWTPERQAMEQRWARRT